MRNRARVVLEGLTAAAVGATLVFVVRARPEIDAGLEPEAPASDESERGGEGPPAVKLAEGRAASGPAPGRQGESSRVASGTRATTLLYGSVRSTKGEPVSGAVVYDAYDADAPLTAFADASGLYALAGVPAGRGLLHTDVFKYSIASRELDIAAGAERIRCDFVVEPRLCIPIELLTTDGTPLLPALSGVGIHAIPSQDLNVIATAVQPGARYESFGWSVSSDGMARFQSRNNNSPLMRRYADSTDAILEMLRPPPAIASLVLGRAVLRSQAVSSSTEKLTFTVDVNEVKALLGSIRCTLDGGDSRAAETASISLSTPFTGRGPVKDGASFVFQNLLPDLYQFHVRWEDGTLVSRTISLQPGQQLDLGAVGPGVLATVRGTVASEAGEAVEAEVHLRTLDTKDMPDLRVDARSTSSRGGTFSLRAPPGRYALLVSSPAWGAAGRFVDTAALTEEPLSLVLRRGTRVVLTPPETRGGSVRYSLRDAEDRIVWARIARLETVVLRVVLTPGRYTLHAETDTGTRHEQAFEVGSSPSRVAVAIPR